MTPNITCQRLYDDENIYVRLNTFVADAIMPVNLEITGKYVNLANYVIWLGSARILNDVGEVIAERLPMQTSNDFADDERPAGNYFLEPTNLPSAILNIAKIDRAEVYRKQTHTLAGTTYVIRPGVFVLSHGQITAAGVTHTAPCATKITVPTEYTVDTDSFIHEVW